VVPLLAPKARLKSPGWHLAALADPAAAVGLAAAPLGVPGLGAGRAGPDVCSLPAPAPAAVPDDDDADDAADDAGPPAGPLELTCEQPATMNPAATTLIAAMDPPNRIQFLRVSSPPAVIMPARRAIAAVMPFTSGGAPGRMAQVTEAAGRDHLAALLEEAGQGRLAGMPPMPERASQLFGETGWLRQLAAAVSRDPTFGGTVLGGTVLGGTVLGGTVLRSTVLRARLAGAERAWRQSLGDLLSELTRIEAVVADLDDDDPATEDRRRDLRADIDVVAGRVRDLSQRDARSLLTELGLLPAEPATPTAIPTATPTAALRPPASLAPPPGLTTRLVNLLGYWAWPSATETGGAGAHNEITLRRDDGSLTHWQVSLPARPQPDLVLRRLDAAPMEVAVFLDQYEQHAAPARNSAAADAAARARLRATGTVVFQLTTDEVTALVDGRAAPLTAPYEPGAQAAAQRGYRALGGDPSRLKDMIWHGSARTLLAFLANPDRDHWRKAATAALAGLLIHPGASRTGLTADDFPQRIRACVRGEPLPVSAGREQTLVRVPDATGCQVSVLIDQRGAGPDAPLGSWAGLAVLDDRLEAIAGGEAAHRRRWAGWLWWGNLLQFAGGQQLAYTALDKFDPRTLAAFNGSSATGAAFAAWDGRVEVIDREVAVLGEALEFLGVPAPVPGQVGYELSDEAWQAELAWPQARVAVLAGGPGSGVAAAEVAAAAAAYRAAGWDARPARDWPPDELAVRILAADRFLAPRASSNEAPAAPSGQPSPAMGGDQ
jgi:hypothetical protein